MATCNYSVLQQRLIAFVSLLILTEFLKQLRLVDIYDVACMGQVHIKFQTGNQKQRDHLGDSVGGSGSTSSMPFHPLERHRAL